MTSPADTRGNAGFRIAILVVAFEAGLGVIGLLVAILVGHDALATLRFSVSGLLWGLAGAIPLIALLPLLDRLQFASIRRIRVIVERYIVPLFRPCSFGQLAAIGITAGVAEEIAFRGFLQAWLIELGGPVIGIAIASGVFGALHLVTPGYGILAGVLGAYIGIMHVWTGNLLVPIVIHGAYDVVALWFLVSGDRPGGSSLSAP